MINQSIELFAKTKEQIKNSRYILIVTSKEINSASICSALALSNYFGENKIKHKVFNANKELPQNLQFISGFSKITKELPKFYDLVIAIGCNKYDDFGFEIDQNIKIINFNDTKNHKNLDIIAQFILNNDFVSSIAYDFLEFLGGNISKNIAISLYSAIYLETKAFVNADEKIFKNTNLLIKKGANPSAIAKELLQNDSLAKYRLIPKVLDTLELHKEGEIATIYAKKCWFKKTGATPLDIKHLCSEVLQIKVVKTALLFIQSEQKVDIESISKCKKESEKLSSIVETMDLNSIDDVLEVKKIVLKEIL